MSLYMKMVDGGAGINCNDQNTYEVGSRSAVQAPSDGFIPMTMMLREERIARLEAELWSLRIDVSKGGFSERKSWIESTRGRGEDTYGMVVREILIVNCILKRTVTLAWFVFFLNYIIASQIGSM